MPRTHLGDDGTTWANNKLGRVLKSHPLIKFYGSADKVVSYCNIVRMYAGKDDQIHTVLDLIISVLFKINAFLATGKPIDFQALLEDINKNITIFMPEEPTDFILTFKKPLAAHFNFLRALIREHESNFYALKLKDKGIQTLLNRLSTLAFAVSVGVEKKIYSV